ncbi:MAG TPA: Stp1/IreP family PP2C-type Ser/Thr phosphatase [Actinomycetota bacterium]|nr:Stp1/IreP family PP2C-type Ser/Thr phosphatase [Actinomycetota bacterium]
MRIEIGSATDIGKVRERNEDSVLVDPPLFVVADGMGGHRGGDVASQVAIETMGRLADEDHGSLTDHVRRANRAVWDRSVEEQGLSGMGTTLTAVRIDGDHVTLAHVGDSRAYLLRNGALQQLTEDHTLVARMVRSGEITKAEAEVHPHKNVMTRSLGTDQDVQVDEDSVVLEDGDRLLLCSDGLTGMVTEDQIQAIVEASPTPQNAAERLVRAANRAGGVDNISVVVLAAIEEGGGRGGAAAPRWRPRPPSGRTVAWWALRIGIPLLVLVVALFGARWYLDRQWYVGPSDGRVAIFQGIPLSILGYELGRPVERFDLSAEDVRELRLYPTFDEGIPVADREAALSQVEQMEAEVEEARRQEQREQREAQQGGNGQ